MELPGILFIVLCVTMATTIDSAPPPAGCAVLATIISGCECEGSVTNPSDIVINCRRRGLKTMPNITGTYDGVIYEFTLFKNEIQAIPDDAFRGLKIKRLKINEENLKNISEFAFRGLEETLVALMLDASTRKEASAPFQAMSNLTNLQELSLGYFLAPANDLEDPSYFQPFSSLQSLNLHHWNLVSIGNDVFRGLTSLKEIQLAYHPSMRHYPVGATRQFKDTIERIDVSNTGITSLLQYSFQGFPKLRSIIFTSNTMNTLEENCFAGLETILQTLDLSFNSIPLVELDQLQNLMALQDLRLQNSGLSTLPQEAKFLNNKPLLRHLKLASNSLLTVPSRIFENLTSLIDLDLSYNHISTMADDSLQGLTSLKSLLLDHQQLSGASLTVPPLAGLVSLTYLTLWATPVSAQSWGSISQAASLESLSMRDTRQTSIPELAFRAMPNLTTFNIEDNQISSINQKTFAGTKVSLRDINLSNNRISYFDSCTFYNFTVPVDLDITGNPLHCDCSLYWLRSAVQKGTITLKYSPLVKCVFPPNRNGTAFTDINLSDFCLSPLPPPVCEDIVALTTTTTLSPTTPTTQLPMVTVTALFLSSTTRSITITWKVNRPKLVAYIVVLHSEAQESGPKVRSRQLSTGDARYEITQLKLNTPYEICVEAYLGGGAVIGERCINHRTASSGTDVTTGGPTDGSQMSSSQEIGIIIGSVVAGLVLMAILIAIIYLMVIRKRSSKEKYPVQPRTFTPAELPTLGYDSKRYRRKKKDETDGKKNNVQVTVISDGQNRPPNIGRVSAGSYQYLQDHQTVSPQPDPPYANDLAVKQAADPYENDVSLRPLPKMPGAAEMAPNGSYYNPAFRNSTVQEQSPNEYSEIRM